MNVLVDTCIVLDALQNREPFAQEAQILCRAVARDEIKGFIAATSVSDLYYIIHRALHSDEKARAELQKLFLSFGILDTMAIDCRNAIFSRISDFEDAILAETANRSGVDCIVTRNLRDFKRANVPVMAPGEFLDILDRDIN